MYPLVSIESQRSSKRMKNVKHAYESKKKHITFMYYTFWNAGLAQHKRHEYINICTKTNAIK